MAQAWALVLGRSLACRGSARERVSGWKWVGLRWLVLPDLRRLLHLQVKMRAAPQTKLVQNLGHDVIATAHDDVQEVKHEGVEDNSVAMQCRR